MIHEREAAARKDVLEVFEALCPHIAGNPYVPHWPTGPQAKFLGSHVTSGADPANVFEALYGGAAGGGKSDALLMSAAQYAWKHPEFAGVCLRRSYAELAQPGALMDRAMRWWLKAGVDWNGTDKLFTFPNGARVKMAYHGHPRDDLQFQSTEYQLAAWDELTHWPDATAYEWISLSRLRRPDGSRLPLRALSASNPGGPGHTWVRNRFVGGVDVGTGRVVEPQHLYVPARLDDNPHLDQTSYRRALMRLHPTVRQQLLAGDWSAREPGDYFRVEWFGPMLDPEHDEIPRGEAVQIRWWDLAASEREDAARTAGVLMARLRSGARIVVHAVAFRATPGKRDAAICRQAHLDGRHTIVGLEIEGGSGGPAQFEALAKRLKAEGFRVVGARPRSPLTEAESRVMVRTPVSTSGKEARADPVASCLERGYQRRGECNDTGEPWWGADAGRPWTEQRDGIRIYAGPWTQAYLDELEGFPDARLLDQVDATSGAWAWLEAHPFGLRVAPGEERRRLPAELAGLHPEDRGGRDPGAPGAPEGGARGRERWRP